MQLQHQRADLIRRLRSTFEQPHVTFWHQPITQIYCANKERFTSGIDDLLVVGVCELRAPLGNQCQEKKRQLQKSELEHDSLRRKASTATSFCWRQSPAAMISSQPIRSVPHC